MNRAAFAALAAVLACAPPGRNVPPVVDLRVCVGSEAEVEVYRRYFKAAAVAEGRGGRDCDVVASGTVLNAGKVTLRSAYDGVILAELEGPADLAPQLSALSLAPGTDAYVRVSAQRTAASKQKRD